MKAIVAIEEMSHAIGLEDGSLLLENASDKRRFVNYTRNHTLICGRRTAELLPEVVKTKGNRTLIEVNRSNVSEIMETYASDPEAIVIGGAITYKTFEKFIDEWQITWFYKRLNAVEAKQLVTYCPKLQPFKLMEERMVAPFMRFSTYKRRT